MEDAWLTKIEALLDKKMKPVENAAAELKILNESFQEFRKEVDARFDVLERRVAECEKLRSGLGGSSSTRAGSEGQFEPTYVELKGFCDYQDRFEKGITRGEAEALVERLKRSVPEALRADIGPLRLRGLRNYSIRVPCSNNCLEVGGVFWGSHDGHHLF
jgi:hypothetical protein